MAILTLFRFSSVFVASEWLNFMCFLLHFEQCLDMRSAYWQLSRTHAIGPEAAIDLSKSSTTTTMQQQQHTKKKKLWTCELKWICFSHGMAKAQPHIRWGLTAKHNFNRLNINNSLIQLPDYYYYYYYYVLTSVPFSTCSHSHTHTHISALGINTPIWLCSLCAKFSFHPCMQFHFSPFRHTNKNAEEDWREKKLARNCLGWFGWCVCGPRTPHNQLY